MTNDKTDSNAEAAGRLAAGGSTAPGGRTVEEMFRGNAGHFTACAAVRYSLRSRTYAPDLVAQWVRQCWPDMRQETRDLIASDVAEEIRNAERYGINAVAPAWHTMAQWMEQRGAQAR